MFCRNPYFNGSCILSGTTVIYHGVTFQGRNPYFNGSCILRATLLKKLIIKYLALEKLSFLAFFANMGSASFRGAKLHTFLPKSQYPTKKIISLSMNVISTISYSANITTFYHITK